MPELSHWSASPTLIPHSVQQSGRRGDKPDGLWISVDGEDDWPTWCRENEWSNGPHSFDHHYRVTLAADADILTLTTVEDVREFTKAACKPDRKQLRGYTNRIDWFNVAKLWQGIIIAPYQWPCRIADETLWYYSWDCASGCIWDASAIAEVHEITEQPSVEIGEVSHV